jgi:uncharacterized surface protein with fasciclin (FAS1) repeats
MRLAPLTTVADESRTMLRSGLATVALRTPRARTNDVSVIRRCRSPCNLATALQAAGLIETLKGKGPFTVFAPTDAAFAKIPKAQLDALLADKAKLTAVLTYHVVPGKVMAKDVKAGKVKTVQGSELTLGTMGGVTVDAAKVVQADIAADNGVIHVIDSVVMPK